MKKKELEVIKEAEFGMRVLLNNTSMSDADIAVANTVHRKLIGLIRSKESKIIQEER